MTTPKWQTPKDLGVLENNTFFRKQLVATSDLGTVYYSLISGKLPKGVQLTIDGLLLGVPEVISSASGESNSEFKFTVRAVDENSAVTDRTFSVLVSGIVAPLIATSTYNLGTYLDGTYFDYQLVAIDNNPGSVLTWKLVRGRLPPGISLTSDGQLKGFFYENVIPDYAFSRIGWDKTSWDRFLYDYYLSQQLDLDFEFTLELSDGVNFSRQAYLIRVVGRRSLTADTMQTDSDVTYVYTNTTPYHLPFITTMPQRLPEIKPELARQSTYFAFKFDAVDFDDDPYYFEISSMDRLGFDQDGDNENHLYGTGFDMDAFDESEYPMPLYLGLNNESGWYTGNLAYQLTHQVDYSFQVYARKRSDFFKQGYRSTFVVSVLGQVDENITWVTNSNLGTIENGIVSGFRIEARSSTGAEVYYKLKSDTKSRTPQGIVLLPNGMLSGRSSTEFFQLDGGTTTFDKHETTYDKIYTFTVVAQAKVLQGSKLVTVAYSERTFTLEVTQVNKKPFENLYLKAFPTADQRSLYSAIINNQDIFPDQLIYRLDDPWFGKSQDLRFLFLPGVNPTELADYVIAMNRNHYTKTLLFGDVKTAYALDDHYNVIYEVVYVEVLDELEGKDPVTGEAAPPAQTISLENNANAYIDENGVAHYEMTPNALGNMAKQLQSTVGISNPNALPEWMTSPQPNNSTKGGYDLPIGYVRACVLAYTVPGASKLIAYRLKNADFQFNRIPFRTDRYQLDNYLSKFYNISMGTYLEGVETTIDKVPGVSESFRFMGSVNYATDAIYEDINGQHINQVRIEQLIDSYNDFQDGDTLIFMQQALESIVPGYYEQQFSGSQNRRAGVWRINIDPDTYIVTLTFLRETTPGDIVDVLFGQIYGGRRFYFEASPKHGPVPLWWPLTATLVYSPIYDTYLAKSREQTTFDSGATRFISNQEQYVGPETEAKYIKFPKYGVFI